MHAISGTMLRDLLVCERRLGLDLHADPSLRDTTSPFVRMLWADGLAHEEQVLEAMIDRDMVDLRGLPRSERERGTIAAIAGASSAIMGAVITHADLIGMPDLLLRIDGGYMALDVKGGSATAGPGDAYKEEYLVQVAHYAFILERSGLGRGDVAGIIDRQRRRIDYDLALPFGRDRLDGAARHARALEAARAIRDGAATRGAISAQCGLCDWRSLCARELRQADDLTRVAGLGRALRPAIETIAPNVAALARVPPPPSGAPTGLPGVGSERLARFIDRARLLADPAAGPILREPLGLPDAGHVVDFDVEADPVRGLVYLHGFWHEGGHEGVDGFVHFFAETPDQAGERDAFARAIEHFRRHRDAHWFHYSAYERTAYMGLARRHPDVCGEDEIRAIFEPSRCTDLYAVISRRTDWPLSSYSIKAVAKACGFAWDDPTPGGAASIEWYDRYVRTGDAALRERIVAYNRDDVRASAHVRAALAELERTGRIGRFRRPS